MELYPAVDLLGGAAVRLVQGDFDRRRDYGDPLALARSYARAGARWVHVVDLDAARTGEPVNRDLVLAIARTVDARVQAGGGVRTDRDAAELLDGGVARVVLGTAAQHEPSIVERLAEQYPGRVAVGLDHVGSRQEVAVTGWERTGGATLRQAVERIANVDVGAIVVTAIDRDGTLQGPDVDGLRAVLSWTAHAVIASGGVRSTADLRALADVTGSGRALAGAIVGTALAEGSLAVEEALAACAPSG
ncbi:MAG TPA: 1-(5-phosphoribosyl)-5-[(5-phosphoribosylamino)methylideneamino] imidazole-4-carboxamide isomerase [Acidimicrobiales bacterium]|nr:1-(5-phosphoribosyl)-5-[(5-phosphoribosylamino)methylideneamino] imidazole-4-carboxamide isomerase [Acidimicrobiales bacterium]